MIPINSPVTATMPGGQKMKGLLEDYEPYDGSFLYLIRDGQDFDYKFFKDSEVKIRYDNPAPFTIWQVNVLAGINPEFSWGVKEEFGENEEFPWGPDNIKNAWECFRGDEELAY